MAANEIKFAKPVEAVTVSDDEVLVVVMPFLGRSQRTRLINKLKEASQQFGVKVLLLPPILHAAKAKVD